MTFHESSWSSVQSTRKVRLETDINTEVDTRLHQRRICYTPSSDVDTFSHSVQVSDYCRLSRCLDRLIQTLPLAFTHLMCRPHPEYDPLALDCKVLDGRTAKERRANEIAGVGTMTKSGDRDRCRIARNTEEFKRCVRCPTNEGYRTTKIKMFLRATKSR
jgi:hypothetical protein